MDELSSQQMLDAVAQDQGQQSPQTEAPQSQGAAPAKDEGPQYLDLGKHGTHRVKFNNHGKEQEVDFAKLIRWAEKGYHRADIAEALEKKEPEYQRQLNDLNQKLSGLSKWQQFDDFARQNPTWAQRVNQLWESREVAGNPDLDPSDPVAQTLTKLQQSFNERLSQFENQFGQRFKEIDEIKTKTELEKESQTLDKELGDLRSKFAEIDFDEPDDNGETVETRVYKHMRDNRIADPKTAFLSLFHDKILEAREQKLRDLHAKEIQKRNKQGFLGESPTPNGFAPGNSNSVKPGSYNYDQLAELAKRDLGVN